MFMTERNLRTLIKSVLVENNRYDTKAIRIAKSLPTAAPGLMLDIPKMGSSAEEIAGHFWNFVKKKGRKFIHFEKYTELNPDYTAKQAKIAKDNQLQLTFQILDCEEEGIKPIEVSEMYMPEAAHSIGLGILIYELLAEMSPDGIASSRNSVSPDAFGVWLKFLRNRSATIKATPITVCHDHYGDSWNVFSKKGRISQREKAHSEYWAKEPRGKFTRETHPLTYAYKSKRTTVYDTCKELGLLVNDPPTGKKRPEKAKPKIKRSQSDWDPRAEFKKYQDARGSKRTSIARSWKKLGYDKSNTPPITRWNWEDLQ